MGRIASWELRNYVLAEIKINCSCSCIIPDSFWARSWKSLSLGYGAVWWYLWLRDTYRASATGKCTQGYGLAVRKSVNGFVACIRLEDHNVSPFTFFFFFFKFWGEYLKNFYQNTIYQNTVTYTYSVRIHSWISYPWLWGF